MFKKICLLAAALALAAACERTDPPGTLARVNGEPISLRACEALLDARGASAGAPGQLHVAELRKNYAGAAAELIVYALARQDLESRGLAPSSEELEEALKEIKEGYGEEDYAAFRADSPIREEEWRELALGGLHLRALEERALLPSIHISPEELRACYLENAERFQLPALYSVCYKAAAERGELEAWCAAPPDDRPPDGEALCAESPLAEVPEPWRGEMKKLSNSKCGSIVQKEGQWRAARKMGESPARKAAMAEVFPILENMVLERKKAEAFRAWLEERLAASKILAFPGLFEKEPE